jgi:putative ABC transport system permease protein
MQLAWKEIKHSKKKYFLIEITLVLMIFMVIFLSGLANGLARAVSAAIENTPATGFILSNDAESLITLSHLDAEKYEEIQLSASGPVAALSIQRTNINLKGSGNKLDVTYFAIDPQEFLSPEVSKGEKLSSSGYSIVLDETFIEEGIQLGDIVEDSAAGIQMTVVGFTRDALYGHSSVGYLSTDTYNNIKTALNPNYEAFYNTAAIQGEGLGELDGLVFTDKTAIVDHIPGYSAEQTTIRMILWVLVVISGTILGVFFYILTIQKQKQFGVMKAIGMRMGEITGMITFQIALLALFGAFAGNLLAFSMAAFLPGSMPFYVKGSDALAVSAAFIGISIFCGLLSTRRIAKVDPLITIGGNE